MNFLAGCLAAASLVLCASVAADTSIDETAMASLRSGEVLHEFVQQDEAGGAIRVTFLFHERPEVLWDVLRTFDRTFEFVPGMRHSEEIEKSETRALVRQGVKNHWLLPQMDYLVEFNYFPHQRIEYRQVEGDLRTLEGSWRFVWLPEEATTIVTHEMRVRSKFPVPRWLIRRSLAHDLPEMMSCLRARAGGSGSEQQAAADLANCQG